jgi:glucose-fructose oxidoreductase
VKRAPGRGTRKPARRRRTTAGKRGDGRDPAKVRYAVIGLGYIAQKAVLPAFAAARTNSELTALISDDPVKLRELSDRYGVQHTFSYDEFDDALASDTFDALYVALPNHLHHRASVAAACAGKHVLCEKPMAMSEAECEDMIGAARDNDVRLMVAYRLHFEKANLAAIETVKSGEIGEPRAFASLFAMQVKPGDIRLRDETGGGTLWDIGIYCINAARYLFQDEPVEVLAGSVNSGEARFAEVDEMTSCILVFPDERLASFTTSFGAGDIATYTVLGTKGNLRVENAYEYAEPIRHILTVEDRKTERRFAKRDQFAPELLYFSDCVRDGREPEPSGLEGLIDVAIIRALYRSARTLRPVAYRGPIRQRRPSAGQEIHRPPPARKPELIHTRTPHH